MLEAPMVVFLMPYSFIVSFVGDTPWLNSDRE